MTVTPRAASIRWRRAGGVAIDCASALCSSPACGTVERRRQRSERAAGSHAAFEAPDLPMLEEVGEGEGELNILAWPGYAEAGKNDPTYDWVTPFEEKTGCKVNVKEFGTSDEAVSLMQRRRYDVVSASGDATLRLIAAGDVEPVNTDLVPNYADISPFLKEPGFNSVDGQMYGIPHGWGANLLMYNTEEVKPAPTSWNAVFDGASEYAGKVTAYDSPIYIADAALYLMNTQPDLGIKNPYALDEDQLAAAVDVLKEQKRASASTGPTTPRDRRVQERLVGHRNDLAVHRQPRQGRRARSRCPARRGLDRLVRHLDGRGRVRAQELRLHVAGLDRRPREAGRRSPSGSVRRRPT